jgi:hypothetical protein
MGPNLANSNLTAGPAGKGGPGSDPSLSSAAGEDGRSSKLEALPP